MFARILEITPKLEKKEEFIRTVREEVLPILKKQPGFIDLMPFVPDLVQDKTIVISLWHEKLEAERYVKQVYPKVEEIVQPFVITPIVEKNYKVETKVCEHLVHALAVA